MAVFIFSSALSYSLLMILFVKILHKLIIVILPWFKCCLSNNVNRRRNKNKLSPGVFMSKKLTLIIKRIARLYLNWDNPQTVLITFIKYNFLISFHLCDQMMTQFRENVYTIQKIARSQTLDKYSKKCTPRDSIPGISLSSTE